MPKNERDILELVKDELDFIKNGDGCALRTPWPANSTFQYSLSCINYGYPYRAHPCDECHLLEFVSPEDRKQAGQDNPVKPERDLSDWLPARIKEIEDKRTGFATS